MLATSRLSLPHRAIGIPSASPARGISSTFMASSSRASSSSSCSSIPEQWRRLVPQSTLVLLQAWNTWVHYATFHLPPEFNGYYGYNALQQIAYFSVVFVFGPLAILTGIAMSPAAVNRFPWYAKLFGGRQSARSIHFLTMLGFFAFIVVHVTLIVMTGFVRNMNHIVMGTDDQNRLGMILGFVGIGVVVLSWVAAHYVSWFYPRVLQHVQKFITYPLLLATLNRLPPSEHYTEPRHLSAVLAERQDAGPRGLEAVGQDRIPGFQAQGGRPCRQPGRTFSRGYRAAGQSRDITMHHCIQGWTGIAKWGGLPMKSLVELVRPKPNAKVVAFFSFGGSLYGGAYYDTQSLENVLKAECLLASEMNGKPSPRGIWSPLAAAGRKSAWLQDGQVD